ncbi:MAG: ATP-grasp domain-containing protein [Chloroflexota bacterium]|nr:ATP-grasp domain-containing protein [Chloroflexota bacterium]
MKRTRSRPAYTGPVAPPRVLLLMAARSYRARAFLSAARQLGVEVVVGSDYRVPFKSRTRATQLGLDFARPRRAARVVAELAEEAPFNGLVNVDDDSTVVAATTANELGLAYNSVDAARNTRDKYRARLALRRAGLPTPWFRRVTIDDDPAVLARRMKYPCVLKPVAQAASRGVIRANDREEFVHAFERIARMLRDDRKGQRQLIVESFLPGPEVALEGLLDKGSLRILTIWDKPDPLDGPFFEETIYVTPSRLPQDVQDAVADTTARAAAALGLRHGPIHAELRIGPGGPWVLEVAARSIGGLCSSVLRFGTGMSLEEIILRHAVGQDVPTFEREGMAAGAMMLPIPRPGLLREVRGRDEALAVPGIEDIEITIPLGQPVVPLPEGDRYLGFVFAWAETPAEVEAALHEAHRRLGFVIATPEELANEVLCLPATPARVLLPMAPTEALRAPRRRRAAASAAPR